MFKIFPVFEPASAFYLPSIENPQQWETRNQIILGERFLETGVFANHSSFGKCFSFNRFASVVTYGKRSRARFRFPFTNHKTLKQLFFFPACFYLAFRWTSRETLIVSRKTDLKNFLFLACSALHIRSYVILT